MCVCQPTPTQLSAPSTSKQAKAVVVAQESLVVPRLAEADEEEERGEKKAGEEEEAPRTTATTTTARLARWLLLAGRAVVVVGVVGGFTSPASQAVAAWLRHRRHQRSSSEFVVIRPFALLHYPATPSCLLLYSCGSCYAATVGRRSPRPPMIPPLTGLAGAYAYSGGTSSTSK